MLRQNQINAHACEEFKMDISLPLDKMTIADKIAAMETLWNDLCRDPESIASPSWHKDVLSEREQEIREDKTKFISLSQAKERIRDKIK